MLYWITGSSVPFALAIFAMLVYMFVVAIRYTGVKHQRRIDFWAGRVDSPERDEPVASVTSVRHRSGSIYANVRFTRLRRSGLLDASSTIGDGGPRPISLRRSGSGAAITTFAHCGRCRPVKRHDRYSEGADLA